VSLSVFSRLINLRARKTCIKINMPGRKVELFCPSFRVLDLIISKEGYKNENFVIYVSNYNYLTRSQ
jgi:hypothetical protein